MALPGPGPSLSINDIGVEFNDTRPHALNEFYRGGILVSSYPANNSVPTAGQIGVGNFYGTNNRNVINVTIASNTANYDAFTNRTPTYFAGKTDITFTINPGVSLTSASGNGAFVVPSGFNPGDTVKIVNNGVIYGRGGNAGFGGNAAPTSFSNGGGGASGGTALQVARPVTVTNNGSIIGGGGGGGGGGAARGNFFPGDGTYTFNVNGGTAGGGGGGGGRGGNGGNAGPAGNAFGPFIVGNGATGGSGSIPAAGGGGAGGASPAGGTPALGGPGGQGGGQGAAGAGGTPGVTGNAFSAGGGGGPAGLYISGNPFVTWAANGTRLGGVG